MTVPTDLPAWHDHTPAYTGHLGADLFQTVTLRLKTTLPVTQVWLLVLEHGEIVDREVRGIPPLDGEGQWFEVELRLHTRKLHYCWQLQTADDNLHLTMAGLHHTRRPYRDWFHYLAGYHAPEWVWKSVFYQIFPDRFRNGDPTNDVQTGEYLYQGRPVAHVDWGVPPERRLDIHAHYGGDLQGITQALPYLERLGVNALWLTPIFLSPSAHRYDVTDYRRIDPHLGGEAAFEELMDAAQEAGIRVVLDGVFNHIGSDSPLFQKALTDESAPERALFTFRAGGKLPYAAFFDVPTMPKVDYGSPAAVNEFFEGEGSVVRHWLRRGVAGWRLDVAQGIGMGGTDEGNIELHRRLKRAAREENPDAYILGERFFDAEAVLDGQGEDGVMNYHGFGLPVMEWFSGAHYQGFASRMDVGELTELLWDAYHVLAPQVALNQFNALDSHDIPRALWRLGGSTVKLRAALTLLFGYPGVPCLYYGTEIGLSQQAAGSMPFNRATMPWDEREWDLGLLADVQKLIRVRRETRVLQEGAMRWLLCEPDAIGFERSYTREDGHTERAAVLASRKGEAHEVEVTLAQGRWTDALTGEEVSGGRIRLEVGAGRLLLQS